MKLHCGGSYPVESGVSRMEWLEGRLPRLVDDLSQWRNEYEDEDAEQGAPADGGA